MADEQEQQTQIDRVAAEIRECKRLAPLLWKAYMEASVAESNARAASSANDDKLKELNNQLDNLLAAFKERLLTV